MQNIWKSNKISEKLKLKLFTSIVLPCMLYASKTWESTCKINNKLNVFQQRCLRKIFKIRYLDHITNETVLNRAKQQKLHELVSERRMKYVGHILRMDNNKLPKIAINWKPNQGKRKRGRPKISWKRTVTDDLTSKEITWDVVEGGCRPMFFKERKNIMMMMILVSYNNFRLKSKSTAKLLPWTG